MARKGPGKWVVVGVGIVAAAVIAYTVYRKQHGTLTSGPQSRTDSLQRQIDAPAQ